MTIATPVSAEPAVRSRRSLRTQLLALMLLPALTVGVSWAGFTLTSQAATSRALLLQGATQTAGAFSARVLDLEETTGQDLDSPELRAGVQARAEDLVREGALPVTDVAVADETGKIVVAYARAFGPGTGATGQDTAGVWKAAAPGRAGAMQALAKDALKAERPLTRHAQGVTLAAAPLTGRAGVTLLALDEGAIRARVREDLVRALSLLGLVLLLSTVIGSVVLSGLIGRVTGLSRAAQAVSEGQVDVEVPVTGNDELTTLGESIDRLAESSRIALERLSRR